MTGAAGGRYAGLEAVQRVAARRERLIEAALDLLGEGGGAACTVRAVCAAAHLTPRYFYESFADRDALLIAVFDAVANEGATKALRAVVQAPDEALAKARAAVGTFVDLVAEDPRKGRVLFVEDLESEPLLQRRAQTMRMFAGLVAEQARIFYRVPQDRDPIVETTALMLAGGVGEALRAWLDGSLAVTREQLIDDCARLFAAMGEGAVAIAQGRRTSKL